MKRTFEIISVIILGAAGSLLAVFVQANVWTAILIGIGIALMLLLLALLITRYPKLIGRRGAFAATGVVICEDKVLLAFNPRQRKWLPPGSHIHGVKKPHKVVLAAIEEEGGYKAEFHSYHDPVLPFDRFSEQVPQPFAVQIEYQLPWEGHVFHYDFFYLLTVKEQTTSVAGAHDKKWVTIKELEGIVSRGETYPDVLRIVLRGFDIVSKTSNVSQERLAKS